MATKERALDDVDAKLVSELAKHARLPIADLAKKVGLSSPSVSDRLRRLEADGVLVGYTVDLNARKLGYVLEAIVRIRPLPGQLHRVEQMIVDEPRFLSCDKVTGEDCFIARLCLTSIEELDPLLEGLHDRAETNTAIIKSSPVKRRLPPLLPVKE